MSLAGAADYSAKNPAAASVRVATRMTGGLGNQLFQYAAGRALAARLGARLVLDCTTSMSAARPFVLDRYPIDADIVRDAQGKPRRRHFRLPGRLGRRLTDAFHDHVPTTYRIDGHRFKVFGERRELSYDPQFERLTGSTYLLGDWQSYRYFEDVADVIRSKIRPAWPLSEVNRGWLGRIESANAVSVHVRRGDYLTQKGPPLACALSYYEAALQRMRRALPEPRFFVFSDDIAWCREIFVAPDMAFVDCNGPGDAGDDLNLMSACRHHITANSSLSWWGAWLARHPEQVVIAPDPWVPWLPENPDLIPKHWITLPRV